MVEEWGDIKKENIVILLLQDADDWFIRYSICINYSFLTNNHFLIGHAIELYLKAVRMEQIGDYKKVMDYNHLIIKMLRDCVRFDSSFLSDIPSIDSEPVKELLENPNKINSMTEHDFNNTFYGTFSELFKIAKDFPNLKYLGLPKKDSTIPSEFGYRIPNPDYIKIIKSIRNYLNWPQKHDPISSFIIRNLEFKEQLPKRTLNYLKALSEF